MHFVIEIQSSPKRRSQSKHLEAESAMAPPAKKRQTYASATFLSGQQGIVASGKAFKPVAQPIEAFGEEMFERVNVKALKTSAVTSDENVKKRKYDDAVDTPLTPKQIKLNQKLASTSTFSTRKIAQSKSKAQHVPSKGLCGILMPVEAGFLSPESSTASVFDSDDARASSPASDVSVYFGVAKLNEEYQVEISDLHELYYAFLNALSLYYAHNGSRAPVDFNQLKPSIERIWGKRGIEITDIQRVIGVAISEYASATDKETEDIEFPCYSVNTPSTLVPVTLSITEPAYSSELATSNKFPLSLSDYGNGKICIELADALLDSHLHSYPINITTLMEKFAKAINRYQKNRTSFAKLPLASIIPCASLKHLSASQKRTRAHIADLKAGAIRAQANNGRNINSKLMPPPEPPLTVIATASPSDPMNRSSALIARILAKKSIADKKPASPSTETLARKAAFQRLDEVVSVLDSLAAIQMRKVPRTTFHKKPRGDQTYSFTMPMLVQSLQGSMRNPISKDEVVRCMGLLAENGIGKGYVGLKDVSTGQRIVGDHGKVVVIKGGVGGLRGKMEDIM